MEVDTSMMLTQIKDFLKRKDKASQELWQVLTALRGPDDGNGVLKDATTGVIRQKFLGPDVGGLLNGAVFGPDDLYHTKVRHTLERTHFTGHARKAFRVLGLNWHEVNDT